MLRLNRSGPLALLEELLSPAVSTILTLGSMLRADIETALKRDPAARSRLEVIVCYPGVHALLLHRIARGLHDLGIGFWPRLISHLGRFLTGIEIHPAAQIGSGVFIDHGMGVVIGETAIVGEGCTLYQGVTLGGTGKETGKRHPTLGRNVIVGAGAKVLGNIRIGDDARVGAGSVVLKDVPGDATVVGIPGRVVRLGRHFPVRRERGTPASLPTELVELSRGR